MAAIAHDLDSDYGSDFTTEEEELLLRLVAGLSDPAKPQGPPVLKESLDDAVDLTVCRLEGGDSLVSPKGHYVASVDPVRGISSQDEVDLLPLPSAGKAAVPPLPRSGTTDGFTSAAIAPSTKHVLPTFNTGDVIYPDLSSTLAEILEAPAAGRTAVVESPLDNDTSPEDTRPPLVRFRTFPKKPFSVSDLVAGAWCEVQYYYTLTRLPGGRKTATAAMQGGSAIHKKLEEEVHETVAIDVRSREDAFGLKVWNIIQGLRTLRETGMTRELEVWGVVDGQVVNGVIDGLTYENPDPDFEKEIRSSQEGQKPAQESKLGRRRRTASRSGSEEDARRIYLFDVKTRASDHLPSGAAVRPTKIQLSLYHRLLRVMVAGELDYSYVFQRYGVRSDAPFSELFRAQLESLRAETDPNAGSDSASEDYVSASSSPAPVTDGQESLRGSSHHRLVDFETLRELVHILKSELRLTFPRGADSLGALAMVEYRRRPRRSPPAAVSTSPAEEDRPQEVTADEGTPAVATAVDGVDLADGSEDEDEGGEVIGANVFYVDDGVLDRYLAEQMQWWQGRREPRGVVIEEAYKCRYCEFAESCEWRREQEAAHLRRRGLSVPGVGQSGRLSKRGRGSR